MIPVSSRPLTFFLGLGMLMIPLVYWPGLLDFALWPRLFLLQGLLLAGIACWWIESARPVSIGPFPLTGPAIATAGLAVMSVLWATNPVEGLSQASKTFAFLLLTLLVTYALPSPAIPRLYALAAVSGTIVSLIGIAQYFGINATLFGWQLSGIPSVGNPSATFGYRNFAASYLAASIPFTLFFAWTSDSTRVRWAWILSGSLMTIFLVYTRTRGAWAGLGGALLIGAFVLAYMHLLKGQPIAPVRSRSFLLLLACCFLLVTAVATRPHQMQQEGKFRFDERKTSALTTLSTTFSPSDTRGRLTVWKHTLEMVWDHPLLGVGLGNWQYAYPRYDRGDWITDKVAPQRPHNDFLWILSETGLLGLGAYIWLLYTLSQTVWIALQRHGQRPEALWIFGIALGLLALVGHSCFSFPKERIGSSFMFWFGIGAISRLSAELHPRRERGIHPGFKYGLGLSILLLVGALVLTGRQIGFDGHYLRTYGAWRQQRWARVVERADRALAWGRLNHRVLLLKGLALHKLDRLQQAMATYQEALRYHPNDGHAALAAVYADLGRHDMARLHYQTEYDLFPNSSRAALDLAGPYERLGQWNQAARIYLERLDVAPSPHLFTRLGRALSAQADFQGAIKAYQQALRLSPDDPRAHNNLGAVLAEQDRFAEAENAYRQALQIQPDYTRVYHNLGDLYADWGRNPQAVDAYHQFLQTWQGDPRFLDLVRKKIQTLTVPP